MKIRLNLEHYVYGVIFAIPLYLVKFSVKGIPINVFEILAIFAIALFLIQNRRSEIKIKLEKYRRYFLPLGIIFAGIIISAAANNNYQSELGIIKSWFIISLVFSWVCAETISGKNILRAIYGSAFFVSVAAWAYFLADKLTFDGRLQAIYNSPNYLAMFLAPAIIIGINLWAENKKYYTFSLLSIISAFYWTFSYAAWGAVCISIIASFLAQEQIYKKWKKAAIAAALFAIVLFAQIGTTKWDNLMHITERSSGASRMMIWRAAEKIIADNWLLGIGPGNFQNKYLEYQKHFSPYLEWAVPHPHNLWLAFWLQAGLLGLIGFVILGYLWGKNILIKNQKNLISIICGAIMLNILIHGFFDTTYFKNDLAVVFWLVFFAAEKNLKAVALEN